MDRQVKKKIFSEFAIVVILLAIFLQTMVVAFHNRMDKTVPEAFEYFTQVISIAISEAKYGLKGYVGYEKVYQTMQENGFTPENRGYIYLLNKGIASVLALRDATSDLVFVWINDLGYVDYARVAFSLFGFKVQSLTYLYFLLLFIEVALFYLQFRTHQLAMAGLILFLLSHFIIVCGMPSVGGLHTVHNNRFMGVLGLLPTIYICLLVFFKKPGRFIFVLGACLQLLLLVFIIHIRTSAMWLIGPFLAIGVFGGFLFFQKKQINFWPLVLSLSLVFFYIGIKPHFIHPGYFNHKNTTAHLFWKPVYVGLALNPKIREAFGPRPINSDFELPFDINERFYLVCGGRRVGSTLKATVRNFLCRDEERTKRFLRYFGTFPPILDRPKFGENKYALMYRWLRIAPWTKKFEETDQDAYSAALQWIKRQEGSEQGLFNFDLNSAPVNYEPSIWYFQRKNQISSMMAKPGLQKQTSTEGYRTFNFKNDFNWVKFEKIVGVVVKNVFTTHLGDALYTIFVIKPFFFFLFYFLYYTKIYSVFSLFFIVGTLICVFFLIKERPSREINRGVLSIFVLFLFSMTIVLMIFPAPHIISEQSILFTMLLMSLVLSVFQRKAFNNKKLIGQDK